MEDLVKLISNITLLILYIAPGIVFLKIFGFVTNMKRHRDNHLFLASIITSYIFVNIVNFFIKDLSNIRILSVTSILLASVSAIIIGLCSRTKWFASFLIFSGINKTINHSIWDDIMDEKDTYLKVYIPSDKVTYFGLYKGREEKEDNLYILLTDYEIKDYEGNAIKDYSKDRSKWAIINTKDINRVDIFYSQSSEKSIRPSIKKRQ